jgi:hypothetical protein
MVEGGNRHGLEELLRRLPGMADDFAVAKSPPSVLAALKAVQFERGVLLYWSV